MLSGAAVYFIFSWLVSLRRDLQQQQPMPVLKQTAVSSSPLQLVVGFVTNFFDTLGIGSYATTTTIFKLGHMVPDERIQAP